MEFEEVLDFLGDSFRNRAWTLLRHHFDELKMLGARTEGGDRYWMFGDWVVISCVQRVENAAVKRMASRFEGTRFLAHISPTQRGGWVCLSQVPMPMGLLRKFHIDATNRNRTTTFNSSPDVLVDMLRELAELMSSQDAD